MGKKITSLPEWFLKKSDKSKDNYCKDPKNANGDIAKLWLGQKGQKGNLSPFKSTTVIQGNSDSEAIQTLQEPIIINSHADLFIDKPTYKVGGVSKRLNEVDTHRNSIESYYDEKLLHSRKNCEKALNTLGFKEEAPGVWSKLNKNDGSLGSGRDYGYVYDLNKGVLAWKSYGTNPTLGIDEDSELTGLGVIRTLSDSLIEYRKENVSQEEIKTVIDRQSAESLEVILSRQFKFDNPEDLKRDKIVEIKFGTEVETSIESCVIKIKGIPTKIERTHSYESNSGKYAGGEIKFTNLKGGN